MTFITAQDAQQMVAGLVTASNPSVYDRMNDNPKFWKIPRSIYYYHLAVSGTTQVTMNFFYNNGDDKIWYDDVEDLVRGLALNARNGHYNGVDGYVPPRHGGNLFDDVWRRKSYLVILLDDQTLKFLKGHALVVNPTTTSPHPNHTFFDAHDLDIDVSLDGDGSEMRSAICFKNHMKKNDRGEDIYKDGNGNPEIQSFNFRLLYGDLPLNQFSFVDSGGTNMGPPVPPPTF